MTKNETTPMVLLGPEALTHLLAQPSPRPDGASQTITIEVRPDALANMARELDTPLYLDNLAIVLSAGKRLKGAKPDTPYTDADLYQPYTPAHDLKQGRELPPAVTKAQLQGRRVLDVAVTAWTNERLASETTFAMGEPYIHRKFKNRMIRVGAAILGGMCAPGGIAYITQDAKWGFVSVVAGVYATTEAGLGAYRTTKAYEQQRVVAMRHQPFAIIRN